MKNTVKKSLILLVAFVIVPISGSFADDNSWNVQTTNTPTMMQSGALSTWTVQTKVSKNAFKKYTFNVGTIVTQSLKEQSALILQQRKELKDLVAQDTKTRLQNWDSLHTQYVGWISKLFRKLTKDEKVTVKSLQKTGNTSLDTAEKAFNAAQKAKDIGRQGAFLDVQVKDNEPQVKANETAWIPWFLGEHSPRDIDPIQYGKETERCSWWV